MVPVALRNLEKPLRLNGEKIDLFKDDLGVARVAPTHCTGDEAIEVFRKLYGKNFLPFMLGSKIEFV